MKVLIACEYSGTVREEFIKKGHRAVSCDLLPTDRPGPHFEGDVFSFIHNETVRQKFWGKDCGIDLIIAHPPCTYLTNSGVAWLYKNKERWKDLIDGAVFFRRLLSLNIPKIAIENPIMHKYAKDIIGVKQSQTIQPWMFGHPESKATCLWLKGLPLLQETNNVKEQFLKLPRKEAQRLHYLPPSEDRWKLRSTTYQGIAEAMANQWSAQ